MIPATAIFRHSDIVLISMSPETKQGRSPVETIPMLFDTPATDIMRGRFIGQYFMFRSEIQSNSGVTHKTRGNRAEIFTAIRVGLTCIAHINFYTVKTVLIPSGWFDF